MLDTRIRVGADSDDFQMVCSLQLKQ